MQKNGTTRIEAEEDERNIFILRLYITGASPNSVRAVQNIKRICEENIPGRYELEIVDVYQQPALARGEQLIALPMLVKLFPLPVKKWVGDMSDEARVIAGLSE